MKVHNYNGRIQVSEGELRAFIGAKNLQESIADVGSSEFNVPTNIPVFQQIFKFVTTAPADKEGEDETAKKKRIDAGIKYESSMKFQKMYQLVWLSSDVMMQLCYTRLFPQYCIITSQENETN